MFDRLLIKWKVGLSGGPTTNCGCALNLLETVLQLKQSCNRNNHRFIVLTKGFAGIFIAAHENGTCERRPSNIEITIDASFLLRTLPVFVMQHMKTEHAKVGHRTSKQPFVILPARRNVRSHAI
jgi:hypothetical protein